MERTQQIELLKEANREDQRTQLQMDQSNASALADAAITKASQSSAIAVAEAKAEPQAQQVATPTAKPETKVSKATLERRVADLDKAGLALEL